MAVMNWISGILMGFALVVPPMLSGKYQKVRIFLFGMLIFFVVYGVLALKVFFFSPDDGGYNEDLSIWQLMIIGLLKIFLFFLIGCLIMAVGRKNRIKG